MPTVAFAICLATLPCTAERVDGIQQLQKVTSADSRLVSKFRSLLYRMRESREVSLKLHLSLVHVIHLHEYEQILISSVEMAYKWRDTAFAWDPDKHNGTDSMSVPKELVWIPDIMLLNTVGPVKPATKALAVTIKYNGDIVYRFPAIYRSKCDFEATTYPFDQHTCTIVFGQWVHANGTRAVDMATSAPTIDVHSYR